MAIDSRNASTMATPVAATNETINAQRVEFFIGADVLDELPAEVRQGMEDDITAWEAFTTSRDTFPMIDKAQVAQLPMPIMLLTAENTLPLHKLVNAELARLLPQANYVTIADATHEMWDDQPDACVGAILEFLQAQAARI